MTKQSKAARKLAAKQPSVIIETETEITELPQTMEIAISSGKRYSKETWLQLRKIAREHTKVGTAMTAQEFEQYLNEGNQTRAEKRMIRHTAYSNRVAAHLAAVQADSAKDGSYIVCLTQLDGRDCKPMTITPENRETKLRNFATLATHYATLKDMVKGTGIPVTELVSASPWRLDIFSKGEHLTFGRASAYHKIGLKSLINIERIVNAYEYSYKVADLLK